MGSSDVQGALWGVEARVWSEVVAPITRPLTTAVDAAGGRWPQAGHCRPGAGKRLAALIAGMMAISSCGADESSVGIILVASETLAEADPEGELGYAFDGDDVTLDTPTITVQTDREVTLTLENRAGQYSGVRGSHDFAVVPPLDADYTDVDLYTDIATGTIADKVLWSSQTPRIFSDDSATVTFVPDTPGTFQYICTIPGHAKLGMSGTLVVENSQ